MEAMETPGIPPSGMGYIRRTGIMECQSGSNHSHSMVSVVSSSKPSVLLLNAFI